MAILYFAGNVISGLSTDTKPTNVPVGAQFLETDTQDLLSYDGTFWWLNRVGAFTKRKWGALGFFVNTTPHLGLLGTLTAATNPGTQNVANDTTHGRHLNCISGTATGNRGGMRANASLTISNTDPKLRIRGRFVDTSNSRAYWGLMSNNEPTGDDPLGAGSCGIIFGYTASGTGSGGNFYWMRNDTTGATEYTDTTVAKHTNMFEIKIAVSEAGTKFSVSYNNGAYTSYTATEGHIPSTTNILTVVFQNETNDSGVAKAFQIHNAFIQTEK